MAGEKKMINVDKDGLEKLLKDLEADEENQKLSITEIMTDEFIQANTNFNNWKEMLYVGQAKTSQDVLTEEFSRFIAQNSKFRNLKDMIDKAHEIVLRKKFGL